MKRLIATAIVGLLAAPVFAGSDGGDAAKGEKGFKKCKACHAIIADDGAVIVKGGKTGPNLYGIAGRAIGSADYKYGSGLKAMGETGAVWDEEKFTGYIQNPKKWVQGELDDKKAKVKMSFKLKKGGEDIYAYLESVGPAPAE
jgi:cytochrome c